MKWKIQLGRPVTQKASETLQLVEQDLTRDILQNFSNIWLDKKASGLGAYLWILTESCQNRTISLKALKNGLDTKIWND